MRASSVPALALCLLAAVPAQAACTIVLGADGRMVANPAISQLSSTTPGGNAASATVTTYSLLCSLLGLLNCYEISVVALATFQSAPAGGDTGVTFAASYSVSGGSLLLGLIPTTLLNGTYAVAVNLTATRASGVFPAGDYRAVTTLRCE
jgi:hypothetical protein